MQGSYAYIDAKEDTTSSSLVIPQGISWQERLRIPGPLASLSLSDEPWSTTESFNTMPV
jgi:hypothetical protein